jgi:hypothetical protein
MQRLDFKQPSERYVQVVGFSPLLGIGETISYANVEARVIRPAEGYIDDASAVVGAVLPSADTVRVELRAGTHGQDYALRVLASTSLGNTWEEDLVLPVWDMLRRA